MNVRWLYKCAAVVEMSDRGMEKREKKAEENAPGKCVCVGMYLAPLPSRPLFAFRPCVGEVRRG